MPTSKEEMLIEEWKDIRETLRYFGNKRFAQFTVFIAINAFMVDAYFKETIVSYKGVIALAGILGAIIFLSMEYGSVTFWKSAAKRGENIEQETTVPLRLFTSHRPKEGAFSATFATYAMYVVMALLWGFLLATAEPPPQKSAPALVEQVLTDAASLAGQTDSQWNLQEMKWDSASTTYTLSLIESGTGKVLLVTVQSTTGKYIKIVRP